MRSIESRLARLENLRADPFSDVLSWIAQKKRYCDLTDTERDRYALYHGVNRQAMEDVLIAVKGSLDDPLERRKLKPTTSELNQIIDQLESQILNYERND